MYTLSMAVVVFKDSVPINESPKTSIFQRYIKYLQLAGQSSALVANYNKLTGVHELGIHICILLYTRGVSYMRIGFINASSNIDKAVECSEKQVVKIPSINLPFLTS